MNGVLVIDKPPGMTSHDVVDAVRRRLQTRKVGHAGTLDPAATGVLVIGVGSATRFLSYSQSGPKRYLAVARFGSTTSTQDATGEVLARADANVSAAEVEGILPEFTGTIEQVPPMVSAVKVGGERLYRKARRGEEIARPARRVTIYDLELVDFTPGAEPEAVLDVRCSAGTFVRTLVNDLGERLGCGAHVRALRRTEAGGFTVADAVPFESVSEVDLRPVADAAGDLARLDVAEHAALAASHGRPLPLSGSVPDGGLVALLFDGDLVAVYRRAGDTLVPDRVVGT